MVEKEILEGSPKGEGKEELGEGEWVSPDTLYFKKTKIWQDYSTSFELKRDEEMGFLCGMEEMSGLYSNGWENMNEMPFDEGWQRIVNLNLILAFQEIWCIKCRDWWKWGARKIRFSRNYCNSQ